jgi:peroxiredoxin
MQSLLRLLPLPLCIFVGSAAAEPPAPRAVLGATTPVFALPALNEEAALEAAGRTQLGVNDFCGVRAAKPKSAIVLYFFDRSRGGDQLGTLARLQRRSGGKGLQVLAISTDTGDLGGLSTWVEGQRLNYPVLRDNHGVVSRRYGLSQLPLTVVVDGDCGVFALGLPMGADLEPALDAELAALLVR